jgi:hypothetical protein
MIMMTSSPDRRTDRRQEIGLSGKVAVNIGEENPWDYQWY